MPLTYQPLFNQRFLQQRRQSLAQQQAQADYESDYCSAKLLYPEFSQGAMFALDRTAYYPINKLFYIATTDWYLVGLINSRLVWMYLSAICSQLRGDNWRQLRAHHVETVPIPTASDETRKQIAFLAESAQTAAAS